MAGFWSTLFLMSFTKICFVNECFVLVGGLPEIYMDLLKRANTQRSEKMYDELRPVSFRIERNHPLPESFTITYRAQQEPEVLWFDADGNFVTSSDNFWSGRGSSQVTSTEMSFGYLLLKPFSNNFCIYTDVPSTSGPGPLLEYTYIQMNVSVEPGYDLSFPYGVSPVLSFLSYRDTGDIRVSEFVESYFYHPREMWVCESPSFLDSEHEKGPIEHVGDVVIDEYQRFVFRVNSAFGDLPPQGVSIFNILPIDIPHENRVIRYQLMVSISVYPRGLSSAPFRKDEVQFIQSRCDTEKSCELGEPCRLGCLAVGNHIEKVEVIKLDNSSSPAVIVPRDTVFFKHVVDASLVASGLNSSSVYSFTVTGQEGYTDFLGVIVTMEEDKQHNELLTEKRVT